MSSSPRLLAGRNLTLGKPAHYVRLILFFCAFRKVGKRMCLVLPMFAIFATFPQARREISGCGWD